MDKKKVSKTQQPVLLDLEVDRSLPQPLYQQIVVQLRSRIANGSLQKGNRLPPTRELASHLGVTRNIIVSVYDQLIGDGVIEGSGRHGTFVSAVGRASAADIGAGHKKPPALLLRDSESGAPAAAPKFDWMPGQTMVRALPSAAWRSACRKAGRHLPPANHGDPQGDIGLRKAIAGWLADNRCLQTDPEQIVITRGSGDFLKFLAEALIRAGDLCAIEDPGHSVVSHALLAAGARLRHVAVDSEGLLVPQAFGNGVGPALLHVTPSHQYPMGSRLSLKRRRALVDAAERHGTLLLENEYGCEFVYAGSDFPTLYSMAPANTVLIGTFANTATPAMRLGFAIAPRRAVERVISIIEQNSAQPSWAGQKIIEALILSGDLDRHVRRSLRHYTTMCKMIRDRLAPYNQQVLVLGDIGGLHVVVRGRDSTFDAALQRSLARQAVKFQPVAKLAVSASDCTGFILGYGHMDSAELRASLDVLEDCINGTAGAVD
ncbi:aminotransferase class I/II-fold pyridoxal phosphate-dependent enzyme [Duganella sp. FT134W]|uniref:Aminotransferase class I/II-fold pyridoxal phosphate-dependent enzyme n=1 Tax=Duganella margarita TaxID=2692170 RepID=A0A7X4GZ61_9BURK|nr:PLP-dependent aminotransferase family protein [Duganella margarita]MYM72285.1 aminotransferase class I/II-fold pyridoxal phosphate-dependent enzyme [Duganella margarita]